MITSGRLGAAVDAWKVAPVLSLRRKRQCQQRLLLHFMSLGAAAGWTRAGAALHGKHVTFPCNALQTRKHIEQRSHVGLVFLHPDDIAFVAVAREFSGQFFLSGNGYSCSTNTIAVELSFLFFRSAISS